MRLHRFSAFIVSSFIFCFGLLYAEIGILDEVDSVSVSFTPYSLSDPIGCVYLEGEYLARFSPDEIKVGELLIGRDRLYRNLPAPGKYRFAVFIEGISGKDTVRHVEGNIISYEVKNGERHFKVKGGYTPPDSLVKFVFMRFAELRRIRANIIATSAQWTADLTAPFMLDDERRLRLTGAMVHEVRGRPHILEGAPPPKASLDWRNKDGHNWVTPIKNQGDCGSCWAFSVVGTEESQILIGLNKPALRSSMDLSEQFVVSCNESNYGCCGGYTDLASNFLRDTGTPDEACFPYYSSGYCDDDDVSHTLPCSDRCSNWVDRTKKICGWTWVNEGQNVSRTALKNGLNHSPLSVCMRCYYPDFWSYSGGVYTHSWCPWPWCYWAGWHAIILVGYNDSGSYWIMKNSWGTDWGESGYMRIAYSESNYSNSRFGTDALYHEYYLDAKFSSNSPRYVCEPVSFTNSTEHCLSITSWNWNFGDGHTSTSQSPSHTYDDPGTYSVRLIACDHNFCDTVTHSVTINNYTPTAPTNLLCEGMTNPTDVTDLTPEFSAIYHDDDNCDYMDRLQIQVASDPSFGAGTIMWDTGDYNVSGTGVHSGDRCAEVSYGDHDADEVPLSQNGATYYWRIRMWDNHGARSDWSATGQFTMHHAATVGIEIHKGSPGGVIYNTSPWDMGLLSTGETRIANTSTRAYVKNTGTASIDLEIKASPVAWTYSDAPGVNRCLLMGLFNGPTVPSADDFSTSYDTLGTDFRPAGTGATGKFAGASDGVNIPAGSGEYFYILFQAPTTNTVPAPQDITITIQAVPH